MQHPEKTLGQEGPAEDGSHLPTTLQLRIAEFLTECFAVLGNIKQWV